MDLPRGLGGDTVLLPQNDLDLVGGLGVMRHAVDGDHVVGLLGEGRGRGREVPRLPGSNLSPGHVGKCVDGRGVGKCVDGRGALQTSIKLGDFRRKLRLRSFSPQ